MPHRGSILLALSLAACAKPPRAAESLLPATPGGVWHRTALHAVAGTQPGVERAFEAVYEGPGKLTVTLYEARVSGTAFEMAQRWKHSPDTVFFDKGRYFVLIAWQQADRQALAAFVRAMQNELAE
jgi:hypothetical protein